MSEILRRIRHLLRRRRFDQELDEEMRFHLDMKAREMSDSGARRQFGNSTRLKEVSREIWGWSWIERLYRDLRYAIRMLRKNPGFTAVAVTTVALGIAANVAVFSFIDALFLRTLNVKESDRLVRIYSTTPNNGYHSFSYPEYAYIRDHATTFATTAAHYSSAPLYVTANGDSGEIQGAVVSARYFPMLGLTPTAGRFFSAEEDSVQGRDAVAVIGHDLWRARFAADPDVFSKSLIVNGRSFRIIGVAPAGFRGVIIGGTPNQIWIPTSMLMTGYRYCDGFKEYDCRMLNIDGRLAPGKTIEQATAEVTALAGQLAAAFPDTNRDHGAAVTPLFGIGTGGKRYFLPLARLLSIVAFAFLAIACANLSGILLARGTVRGPEIAMRRSLGASRFRIFQQLVTESLLLASLGGLLGLALSVWASRLLIGFYTVDSEGYQKWYDLSISPRIVAYSLGLSILTGLVFGFLPALQSIRKDTAGKLKAAAQNRRGRLGSALVVVQIAISLCLVVGAGLLARSVARLRNGENWDPNHVVALRLRPKLIGYTVDKAEHFQGEVLRRLGELQGLQSVSLARAIGLAWKSGPSARLSMPGQTATPRSRVREVANQEIASHFFETLRIPFLAGRDFDNRDLAGSPLVAIVNQAMAEQLWPHASPLDQTLTLDDHAYRVIGVVKNAQFHNDLENALPMVFTSYWQDPEPQTDSRMCIRVAGDPAAALPSIRRAIASIDPNVPITEAMPMIDQIRGEFTETRLAGSVLLSSAGLALFLSAIGLYGVLSFLVSRRTREIGIRMAIGARPGQVLGGFLRQGLVVALLGSALGLGLALIGTRFLAAWLYGVRATDALVFSGGTILLVVMALLATLIPARRAARIDPIQALRYE
jgi:predicted permease